MYQFPKDLFCDVRITHTDVTQINILDKKLTQNKTKTVSGAMIRIFDGKRWYYSSTVALDRVQDEIDSLAAMAQPDPAVFEHPTVKALEVNKDKLFIYKDRDVRRVSNEEKLALLRSHQAVFDSFDNLKSISMIYADRYQKKEIYSCLGTDVSFDQQFASVNFAYTVVGNAIPHVGHSRVYKTDFSQLTGTCAKLKADIQADVEYAAGAVPVEPGTYTCVLSPVTAGVFAHESFGHKSEADFMIGDKTMKKEWKLGSCVGNSILNIMDSGLHEGSGYAPYDDEGCRAKTTYLIRDGILSGRLHSAATAADLGETVTGNARAITFEYEPIVRMTCTYIGSGSLSREELFAGVEDGIYICDYKHGSGMSTFTIAPSKAYRIRDGKIAEPLRVSVISGNVMETLHNIDGLSDQVEFTSSALGGCGKMEQFPLPVAFGGPYVRVNNITVQ